MRLILVMIFSIQAIHLGGRKPNYWIHEKDSLNDDFGEREYPAYGYDYEYF